MPTPTNPGMDEYIKSLTGQISANEQAAKDYNAQANAANKQLYEYPELNQAGYYDEYQKQKKPALEALLNNIQKPVQEISPEQAQKAKTAAGLTDTFNTLAEMFAHSQGAHVQNRGNEPSSTTQTNARLKAIEDKYNANLERYNLTKANAEMQDFNQRWAEEKAARNEKRQNIIYQIKTAQAAAKAAAENANKARKDMMDYIFKNATLDETKTNHRNTETINRENSKKYTGSLQGADAQDYININEQAEQLPKDWLVSKGYMNQTQKGLLGTPTYTWKSNATPAIKKGLIEKYKQEMAAGAQPAANSWENSPFNLSGAGKQTGSQIGNVR